MPFSQGDKVEWDWGHGTGQGEITKVYTQKTTVTIKGSDVTRDADEACPAFLIEQDDGDAVLKSASELRQA